MSVSTRSATVRTLADTARAERQWWLDAYYRRFVCEKDGARWGDWLQYGHSLKEAGRYDDAYRAYRRAASLDSDNAEIALQIGHLLKIQGRFGDAEQQYRRSLACAGSDGEEIGRELDLLRSATAQPLRRFGGAGEGGVHIVVSSAVPLFDESAISGLEGLGGKDYSYAFAMRNVVGTLDKLGVYYTILEHPEFAPDAASVIGEGRVIHLGFYPPERVRLLKGAYNVICFAWEFDRLRSAMESGGYHAFADQATLLSTADELWLPSAAAAATVGRLIEKPVRHVPAPVMLDSRRRPRAGPLGWRDLERSVAALKQVIWQPLAIVPRVQSMMNGMATAKQSGLRTILARHAGEKPPSLFVTVLNVHDFRKQLRPMLEGFLQFADDDPDAYLLIKLTTPDRGKLTINEFIAMDQIADPARLTPPLVSDRIWITDAFLTSAEMAALYDLASFYCCTSYAEGQNLPLLEAMSGGVVPVSVDVTAMADYIDADNAVVIPSTAMPADHRLTQRYGMIDLALAHVRRDDVSRALRQAHEMAPEEYALKSVAAARTVAERFGAAAFGDAIERLVAALQAEAGG